MTLYSVQDLTCRHGLLTAVRGISFDIDRGDVLCIIGANGGGGLDCLERHRCDHATRI